MDLAKPLKASEMFWNLPEPRGGYFESQTSEIRPLAVSCTKNVNILSENPQAILYNIALANILIFDLLT